MDWLYKTEIYCNRTVKVYRKLSSHSGSTITRFSFLFHVIVSYNTHADYMDRQVDNYDKQHRAYKNMVCFINITGFHKNVDRRRFIECELSNEVSFFRLVWSLGIDGFWNTKDISSSTWWATEDCVLVDGSWVLGLCKDEPGVAAASNDELHDSVDMEAWEFLSLAKLCTLKSDFMPSSSDMWLLAYIRI